MPDTQVRITASGLRALARQFQGVDKEVGKVGKTGGRVSRLLSREFTGLRGKVGGLKSAVAGLGVAMKARDILSFSDKLGGIQAKAKLSNQEATKLRDSLLALGPAFGVNKDEAIGAAEAFQDYTGVLKEGAKDLQFLAKLHKATGAEMKKLAIIDALFIKQGFDVDQRVKGFAQLVKQADAGTVSLKDMARVLPEVLGTGKGFGFEGARSINQLGTAMQVVGEPLGGKAEESRTVVLRLMNELSKGSKKIKGRLGVRVFDPQTGDMRDITTIMREITEATGGKIQGRKGLGAFFGDEALKGASAFANAFKGGGVQKVLGAGAGATGETIEAKFRARAEGIAKDFDKVQRGLGTVDQALQKFGATVLGFVLQDPGKSAAVAGGGYAAIKVLPAIARFLMKAPGGGAGKGGVAGALGVQPVFVVNLPGAGLGGAGAGLGGAGGAGGPGGGKGKIGAGRAIVGAVTALGVGYAAGTGLDELSKKGSITGRSLSGDIAVDAYAVSKAAGIPVHLLDQGGKSSAKGTTQAAALKSTARGLAKAVAGGATTFGGPGGKQALTEANVAAALQAKGAEMGLSGQELKDAVVSAIAIAFKKNPIVVQAKGGLAAPGVQKGRGAPQ
jgi:TP901 family phage tail tape measure protein